VKSFGHLLWIICIIVLFNQCSKNKTGQAIDDLLVEALEIQLNPNGNSPLSAQFNFNTEELVRVNYQLLNTQDIEIEYDAFKLEHSIAVWGLLPNTENEIQLTLFDEKENYQVITKTIVTDSLPTFLPEIDIVAPTDKPAFYLLEFQLAQKEETYWFSPFIIDQLGRVRWYTSFESKYYSNIELLKNGHFLTAKESEIFEIDFAGKQHQYSFIEPYVHHHDMVKLPNGNILICVSIKNDVTHFDRLIEWDMITSTLVKEWDLREIFDFNRKVLSNSPKDWLHTNSVWFSPTDKSITISGRHQGIVNFSYEGEVNWMLAPHLNWGNSGLNQEGKDMNQFLLTAIDENGQSHDKDIQKGFKAAEKFDWPFGQHAAMLNTKGNVLTFDNGWYRHYHFQNSYTRVAEYAIDINQKTIQQVWQNGKDEMRDFYTPIFGDVDELPNNDLLILAGFNEQDTNRGILRQINPANDQVTFEVHFNYLNQFGTGNFIWGEFDHIYRAEQLLDKW